jgi:hypothetical protein
MKVKTKCSQRLVMDVLVGDANHKMNSTLHRASGRRREFLGGGNMESISSFHRTASAKVRRERCGSIPLQSGNSKPGDSRRAQSLVGAGVS